MVTEVAFSLMLLVGAGLMIKSFMKLQSVSPGFIPDRILTMHLTLPRARYDTNGKINSYNQQLIERVTAVRGVEAAGLSISLPPDRLEVSDSFSIEGNPGRKEPASRQFHRPYQSGVLHSTWSSDPARAAVQ